MGVFEENAVEERAAGGQNELVSFHLMKYYRMNGRLIVV